jgi:roadblock/LC7 domain-containing protein
LFSHLINKEGERSQDHKSQYKSDGYKSKKKAKAMQAMCNANQITVTPTAQAHNKKMNMRYSIIEKGSSIIDIDGIIANKNI